MTCRATPCVGRAFGGEGALHLGEKGQQEEDDATHAFVGNVDRRRVGQEAYGDIGPFSSCLCGVKSLVSGVV